MINLSTPPNRLIQELSEDYPKAIYWAKNKDKEALEWAKERRRASITKPEVRMGKDYTSKNGNRWLIFYLVQPVGHTNQNAIAIVSFCYYETIGSIGAFCLINGDTLNNQYKANGCCIYTSHFFRRLSERSGVSYQSKEMLMAFVTSLDQFTALLDNGEILEPGEVVIKLKGGQGRGVILSTQPTVYEIRTYIPESSYNAKQKAAENKMEPYKESDRSATIQMLITHCRILMDELGYVSSNNIDFWRRCPASCAPYLLEGARRWDMKSMAECEAVYLMLLQGIANQMGIAHFDPKKAKEHILRHLMHQLNGSTRSIGIPSLLDIKPHK